MHENIIKCLDVEIPDLDISLGAELSDLSVIFFSVSSWCEVFNTKSINPTRELYPLNSHLMRDMAATKFCRKKYASRNVPNV